MNRDIKFRVWDKFQNKFLDYPCYFNNKNFNEFTAFDRHFKCDEEGCIVQQYTGLKDKNGRELYEGDIIKYPLGQVIITAEVRWGDCSWILYDIEYKCIIGHLTCAIKRYEVIGNIFENTDLLK